MITENLYRNPTVKPPIIRRGRGRPRIVRIHKSQWKQGLRKYSNCHTKGYNRRLCKEQPGGVEVKDLEDSGSTTDLEYEDTDD